MKSYFVKIFQGKDLKKEGKHVSNRNDVTVSIFRMQKKKMKLVGKKKKQGHERTLSSSRVRHAVQSLTTIR